MTGFLLTAKQKLMLCINKRLYWAYRSYRRCRPHWAHRSYRRCRPHWAHRSYRRYGCYGPHRPLKF